jgi:hypothetical protein
MISSKKKQQMFPRKLTLTERVAILERKIKEHEDRINRIEQYLKEDGTFE